METSSIALKFPKDFEMFSHEQTILGTDKIAGFLYINLTWNWIPKNSRDGQRKLLSCGQGQDKDRKNNTVNRYITFAGYSKPYIMTEISEGTYSQTLNIWDGLTAVTEWGTRIEAGTECGTCTDKANFTVVKSVSYGANSKQYLANLSSGAGSANIEAPNANDVNALTDSQLPNLFDKSVTEKVNGNASALTIQERMGINVDAKMDTSADIKDLVAYIEGGEFYYEVRLGADGLDLGTTDFIANSDDDLTIILFGEQYKLKSAKLTGAPQIVLKRINEPISGGGGSS